MPFYKVGDDRVKNSCRMDDLTVADGKGKRLGNAGVHDKQALVLVNLGGATGSEVVKLAEEVVRSVKEKFGVAIHPEVNFIGVKQ